MRNLFALLLCALVAACSAVTPRTDISSPARGKRFPITIDHAIDIYGIEPAVDDNILRQRQEIVSAPLAAIKQDNRLSVRLTGLRYK